MLNNNDIATANTYILCIDTATEICSVALAYNGNLVAYREEAQGRSHAQTLLPFVEEVLQEAAISPAQLSAVALSMGPGSYTGLRIGTSSAKGLCYSLEIPLLAIPTLQMMAAGTHVLQPAPENAIYCPMLDARRMEVFAQLFDNQLNPINEMAAVIVDENSFHDILVEKNVVFCGNGAEKCRPLLEKNPHALFHLAPISAKNMIPLAFQRFNLMQFEDVAYFTPLYGKEYIAAKPRVKGLN